LVTPDGDRAVVVSGDGGDQPRSTVHLIDLEGDRIVSSTIVDGQQVFVAGLAPDGRTVGLGSIDGRLTILDVLTGRLTPAVEAHDGVVQRVSFAPDGATLVTSGRDGTVKLWDAETAQLLGSVQPLGARALVYAWFIGPGRVLIAVTTGEMFAWDTSGDAWEAHACAVAGRNLTTAEWAKLFPDRAYRATCAQFPAGA
jgi:hypothetical protein